MGFSLSAAFAIIGMSIFVAIEIFSTQFSPVIYDYENSNSELIERYIKRIETNINITQVNITSNLTNYDFNITIKNTGANVLKTNEINVLINGNLESFQCNDKYIIPIVETNLILKNLNYNGIVRIKIITGNGIEEYKEINL